MRRDQFETHLEVFALTKAWQLCERETPATPEEIRAYEVASDIGFPREYVDLVTSHGAGQFGFTEVFSIRPGEWCIDVQRHSAPGLPSNFVPVSDSGCGDFYGFVVENGRCSVVRPA